MWSCFFPQLTLNCSRRCFLWKQQVAQISHLLCLDARFTSSGGCCTLSDSRQNMDPEFSSCSSSTIDSIRRAGIGRRGGLKVRGGRLPPVQIQSVIAKKKVVAPKIPQRRVKVKQEKTCDTETVTESYQNRLQNRGRIRGRGTRVYIQTEGTLLGDGPALRVKKEREYVSYERTSVSRSTKSSVNEVKVDEKIIENLLETYDDTELYEDSDNVTMPIKYPVAKLRIKREMKQEIAISEDVKNYIKVEPGDSSPQDISLEGNFFSRIKNDSFPEINNLIRDIKKTEEGKSVMLLMQFPSCLPSEILSDIDSKDKKKTLNVKMDDKNEPIEESCKKSKLREIHEGHLGKFQVLRSGKMRLVIGSIQISVEEGIVPESLSEVISISAEGNDGDIIVLGKIERKMILKPHFTVIKNNFI